ncbi:MAG: polysaccharide deacetylase family protein [Spirochaetaceae bacterium]|jgi:peptidoglycan/xylan/chitin deacetylase (PgdA/CDA1 family)|nr:polysaccharide deacetylase family protein [Spirochaetaceae bacterium]
MMNFRRNKAAFFLFLLILSPCWGGIRFSGLDISDDNRLLFIAESSGGKGQKQSVLLHTHLPDRTVRPLSAFPEKMELVEGGKYLLIQNAFGCQRLSVEGGLPQSFPGFPMFRGGFEIGGRAESTVVSPDGKWLLYVEPTTYARGNLMLLNGTSGNAVKVSSGVERPGNIPGKLPGNLSGNSSGTFFPALWSPDSRGFMYSKDGRLYFYSVIAQSAPPDEQYRIIGDGALNSFRWGNAGNIFYMRGSNVHRTYGAELFARAIYSGFFDFGQVVGKTPFEFDPNFDSFWIAPDNLSMILCKGGRNLIYCSLGMNEDAGTGYTVLPYVVSARPGVRINVVWSDRGIITVLIEESNNSKFAYRLNTRSGVKSFEAIGRPPEIQCRLSPNGEKAVLWGETGLYLYDYQSWTLQSGLDSFPVQSCIWMNNNELVIGGKERIERLVLSGNVPSGTTPRERKLLCLSSIVWGGFEDAQAPSGSLPAGSRRIVASTGNGGNDWYITGGNSPWILTRIPLKREAKIASADYRVYLENSRGFWENVPMVRNTVGVGTFSLFDPFEPEKYSVIIDKRNSVLLPSAGDYVFTNGRQGSPEIALCFDLYDDADGLRTVLETLDHFGLKVTFFFNGEFIRRYPQSARDIASLGHEAGSMFYAPLDLSDSRYKIDNTFITRGLARNEDEFFKTTGKELSLLWHPPYYMITPDIAAAAATAGYRTIGRNIDSKDWLSSSDARRLGMEQRFAADMIDAIAAEVKGGSIIPIRLGSLERDRPDYLFNSLEVLINALIRKGYEIVPVSTLVNKSR